MSDSSGPGRTATLTPPLLPLNSVVTKPYGDNKIVEFALWDTAGQEEYDRLRPLSYPESDVLLVCFAIDYPTSLDNVMDKVRSLLALREEGDGTKANGPPAPSALSFTQQWFPEVAHFCEGVPVILVGTKADLRNDQRTLDLLKAQGRAPVSYQEGADVARKMGAKYAEVSAKMGTGVHVVFEAALREGMRGTTMAKIRKAKCTVL